MGNFRKKKSINSPNKLTKYCCCSPILQMSKPSLLPRLVRWCLSETATAELKGSHALQVSSVLHALIWKSGVKRCRKQSHSSVTEDPMFLLMIPPGSKGIGLEKPCRVFTDCLSPHTGPIHCHIQKVRSFRCSLHAHFYFRHRRQSFLKLFLLLKTEERVLLVSPLQKTRCF